MRNEIRFIRILAAAFILLGCGARAAEERGEDWPQHLGPHANGISNETGLLDKWPAEGPPLLWSKAIGTGYSAPSVRGNKLVLHHRLKGEEIVECFEVSTAKSLWRHGYPSQFVDPYGYNNGPRCTPLLTTNLCYTFGAEGKLICLEMETGKLVWQRDTAKDWNVPEAFFGVGSTPILEGDKLIVMVGGQPNSGMVALDARTGKTMWENVGKKTWQGVTTIGWRAEAPYQWTGFEKSASYSTPVAATIHGRRQIFCLMRQGLVSLNPTNGEVNFSRWFQSIANDSVNAMSPVVQDDLVLISAAYYRVGAVLLRVKPDGKSFEEVWRDPRNLSERDPATGSMKVPVLELHWTTPIHQGGYLYAFSGRNEPDARFRCVELKTGKLMWDVDQSWIHSIETPKVYGRGSCIMADGKLIVLGEAGLLGLFQVDPLKPVEISRYQVPDLHYSCWPAPVLSRSRLYLRSEDRLVCFDLARH
jgi:outer membrane protein assembly factor BamB